ncbi:MAG: large conductance mechanosensitive channel protein MscL, partial [Clostridia bacterium]|nr:large conductance mechanosensitive channel protein MscL [Clostridia bacterium]
MKKFFKEFKEFISRGNVLDMAVGIIIGSAFTAIITAVVGNILTPLINWIPGTGDTGALQVVLRNAVYAEDGSVLTEALVIDFGSVISAIITFLITALVLFLIIKAINDVLSGGKLIFAKQKKSI